MFVSVCIIAYNEEKALPSLLSDIAKQTYSHKDIEVVLVDSMSTDKTKEIMTNFATQNNDFKSILVKDNPKRKQASGWNIAINSSRGDVIIRIDAHTMIPEDFVEKNVDVIEGGEYVSGGPRPNIVEDETPWKKTLLLAEKSMFGSSIAPYRTGHHKRYVKSVFHGAYRREVFEKAGLFNEKLGRTEDNEMHYRIRKAGYKICFTPDIISYQHVRSSWRGIIKQKFLNGYWIGLTLSICPYCFSIFHFIPFAFCLALIVSIILYVLGYKMLFLILALAYIVCNLVMSFLAILKRKPCLQYIALPIIFLSLHISYGIGTMCGLIKMPFWWYRNVKKEGIERC